ncbi:MAG TPA: alpha/beta fold hydrolase [Gammaproteobacteria bacterium]|nr:alpha/beta fold hydrolase [Gammaproteobacteria bacterium]
MHTAEPDSRPAIVFLHGILGADVIRKAWPGFRYFRGIRERLQAAGASVHFPLTPSAASIAHRADILQTFIARLQADRIHLIAHSMGGLDARYLVHHFDPAHRIRSLTTIGTPHRGSELVHWVDTTRGLVQSFARHFLYPGILELTPQACAQFNQDTPDRTDVLYRSWAGCRPAGEMPLLYRKQTRILQQQSGDNDSQVSVASAKWGEFMGTVRADHLELVGWNLGLPKKRIQRPFEHTGFYQLLVRDILEPAQEPP